MRVLLTGASGFVGAHILKVLLAHGHEVVATVRSSAKGDFLIQTNPGHKISYTIVKDIPVEGAFDHAVQAQPGFDAVIHSASPVQFKIEDNKKDLLDPAVNGTLGILKAIKAYAPTVRRVVITSSFAAMFSPATKVYDESAWNPVTWEEALAEKDPFTVYRASKKFAERAAWDFMDTNFPEFDLVSINPPIIYGPVVHELADLNSLNASNVLILNMIQGGQPRQISGYVDVRDVAEAHVRALEVQAAGGKRWLITAGLVNDQELIDAMRENVPVLKKRLNQNGKVFQATYEVDNSKSKELLGQQYRSYKGTVVDLAQQLLELGA